MADVATGIELDLIGTGEAEYIVYLLEQHGHADNGNGSIINPLTCVHFTTGEEDHYTVQSTWMQALCYRKLGKCDDGDLVIMATAISNANRKAQVKAAVDKALGQGTKGIANLNFYPAGGSVGTCEITLQTVMERVQNAIKKVTTEKLGRIMLQADGAFLKERGIGSMADLANFRLKEGQQGRWEELRVLVDQVCGGTNKSRRST